jgi:TPR repeat protein
VARLDFGSQELISQSAESGGPDALFQLGLMYSSGRDVELDTIAAHKWFNLAALRGNADARILRQEISREMSRSEISKAQRQARQWLSKYKAH